MERTVILRRIGQLTSDIDKLKSTLAAIEGTDIALYPENYNMLTTDAALRSELIACRMRHLIYQSTDTKKATYLASAGVVQGIKINDNNGILEITLPKQTKYIDLDELFNADRKRWNEQEFLLPRNSKFKVTGYDKKHDIIQVEYLLP